MIRSLTFLTLLCLSSPAWAEEAIEDPTAPFALIRNSVSASGQEGLGRIEVDAALFEKSDSSFADVRLFRIREEELLEWPYLVRETRPRRKEVAPREVSSEIVAFDKSSEDLLVYTVELPEKSPEISQLRIHTPLRNFEKTVSVFGKSKDENWTPLVSDFLIYDREAFVDFRRTDIPLPKGHYDQIRIQLEDATDEQQSDLRRVTKTLGNPSGPQVTESTTVKTRNFRVDRFSFFTPKQPRQPERGQVTYPIQIVSQELIAKEGREEKTDSEIILETKTIPLDQISLTIPERNFRRAVRIEVPRKDDPEKWRSIGSDTIHRYDLAGLEEEKLNLRFSEIQADRIRLVIDNGDNRPIAVSSAKGMGPLVEFVFLTEPGDQWQLAYHAPAAELERPDYDTAVLQRAESEGIAEEGLTLSDPSPNPVYDESAGITLPPWFAQKWILHLLIAAVVALLIWVLYGAAKKVEAVE